MRGPCGGSRGGVGQGVPEEREDAALQQGVAPRLLARATSSGSSCSSFSAASDVAPLRSAVTSSPTDATRIAAAATAAKNHPAATNEPPNLTDGLTAFSR